MEILTVNMCLFCYSWEYRVRIFEVIRNDMKSMWLVGEEEGQIHIGFIVSFTQSTTQSPSRVSVLLKFQFTFTNFKFDFSLNLKSTFLFFFKANINCCLCLFFLQFAMGDKNGLRSSFCSMNLRSDEEQKGSQITAVTVDGGTNKMLLHLLLLLQA